MFLVVPFQKNAAVWGAAAIRRMHKSEAPLRTCSNFSFGTTGTCGMLFCLQFFIF